MSNQASELAGRPADYEHLLERLRERDRLTLDYVAALDFSDEQYWEWHRTTWKSFARNQLALIQAVRPVTYADYRNRITILSPTAGVVGPDRLVTGWMLDSEEQLRREAESSAVLALFGEELPAEPLAELPPLPAFVEPETTELEPLLPVIEEPLLSVEEYHAAPNFEGLFLAPTVTLLEAGRLIDALFEADEKLYQVEDSTTLGELYQRKRALLLAGSPAPISAAPVDDADRLAAIELRKRNRAKLQASRPDLVDALNNPFVSSNSITFDE